MQPGEIHLAAFPFGDAPGMKLRPVLLLTPPIASTHEILVAYISSVILPTVLPTDIVVDPQRGEHRPTGLKVTSVLRLHKLATIHVTTVRRRLGRLSTRAMDQARAKLRSMLEL
jgi:mRNA interferase MazF